jgi:hypothetical protein
MLDLTVFGFSAQAAATGLPGYHPVLMLRVYLPEPRSSRRDGWNASVAAIKSSFG